MTSDKKFILLIAGIVIFTAVISVTTTLMVFIYFTK